MDSDIIHSLKVRVVTVIVLCSMSDNSSNIYSRFPPPRILTVNSKSTSPNISSPAPPWTGTPPTGYGVGIGWRRQYGRLAARSVLDLFEVVDGEGCVDGWVDGCMYVFDLTARMDPLPSFTYVHIQRFTFTASFCCGVCFCPFPPSHNAVCSQEQGSNTSTFSSRQDITRTQPCSTLHPYRSCVLIVPRTPVSQDTQGMFFGLNWR